LLLAWQLLFLLQIVSGAAAAAAELDPWAGEVVKSVDVVVVAIYITLPASSIPPLDSFSPTTHTHKRQKGSNQPIFPLAITCNCLCCLLFVPFLQSCPLRVCVFVDYRIVAPQALLVANDFLALFCLGSSLRRFVWDAHQFAINC